MGKQRYCKFCQSYDDVSDQMQEFSEKMFTDYEFDFFGERVELCNYIQKGKLVLESDCGGFGKELGKIKINFCPMCGRSLKTEDPRK